MDAGHPRNERFGILKRPTELADIHPGKELIPPIDEVKREIELPAPHQAFIIYTPVAIVGVRASPSFFSWHEGAGGTSGIFSLMVG